MLADSMGVKTYVPHFLVKFVDLYILVSNIAAIALIYIRQTGENP